jgi:predicted transcriptional regulator YheO
MAHKIDQWCLDLLERLAEGIVAVVGPHCEVVVHDFSDLEHSAVIVAGNVTGREPGAPIPDLDFIADGLGRSTPDQLNYRARIGEHYLQSSTIWIRDPQGNPTGAVCVNVDYSSLLRARDMIDALASSTESVSDLVISDTFARDVSELIKQSVREVLREEGLQHTEEMSYENKLQLIEKLEKRGLFQMRGAVNQVAAQLGVSRASVYNYRSSLKTGEE